MFARFQQFFQDIAQSLMGASPAQTGVAAENERNHKPASIANFIYVSTTPGIGQDMLMGDMLQRGVSRYDFAQWCRSFAEGVNYIYRKYGTAPSAISIIDMPENQSVYYNYNTQTIFISRAKIERSLHSYLATTVKVEPYDLSPTQLAVLSGVEEAFHHYQMTVRGDYYLPLMASYEPPGNRPSPKPGTGYNDNHPLEADAKKEVQEALRYFGFDRMPTSPIHDPKWQKRIEEQQLMPGQSPARAN